ncbi:hypothetical protein BDW22DRAFT_1361870 [Trametopsis cervina]|nr:hypothetical protein BDW22DRAFT_1361870 [Trametopsis cervina]
MSHHALAPATDGAELGTTAEGFRMGDWLDLEGFTMDEAGEGFNDDPLSTGGEWQSQLDNKVANASPDATAETVANDCSLKGVEKDVQHRWKSSGVSSTGDYGPCKVVAKHKRIEYWKPWAPHVAKIWGPIYLAIEQVNGAEAKEPQLGMFDLGDESESEEEMCEKHEAVDTAQICLLLSDVDGSRSSLKRKRLALYKEDEEEEDSDDASDSDIAHHKKMRVSNSDTEEEEEDTETDEDTDLEDCPDESDDDYSESRPAAKRKWSALLAEEEEEHDDDGIHRKRFRVADIDSEEEEELANTEGGDEDSDAEASSDESDDGRNECRPALRRKRSALYEEEHGGDEDAASDVSPKRLRLAESEEVGEESDTAVSDDDSDDDYNGEADDEYKDKAKPKRRHTAVVDAEAPLEEFTTCPWEGCTAIISTAMLVEEVAVGEHFVRHLGLQHTDCFACHMCGFKRGTSYKSAALMNREVGRHYGASHMGIKVKLPCRNAVCILDKDGKRPTYSRRDSRLAHERKCADQQTG